MIKKCYTYIHYKLYNIYIYKIFNTIAFEACGKIYKMFVHRRVNNITCKLLSVGTRNAIICIKIRSCKNSNTVIAFLFVNKVWYSKTINFGMNNCVKGSNLVERQIAFFAVLLRCLKIFLISQYIHLTLLPRIAQIHMIVSALWLCQPLRDIWKKTSGNKLNSSLQFHLIEESSFLPCSKWTLLN